jgi:hypothetical protein
MKKLILLFAFLFIVLIFGCARQQKLVHSQPDSDLFESSSPQPKPQAPTAPPPAMAVEDDLDIAWGVTNALKEAKQPNKPRLASDKPTNPVSIAKYSLNNLSSQLFDATMAFAVPSESNIDDSIKVQLLIDVNKTAKELENELTSQGNTFSGTLKISNLVYAQLTAPDFDISKLTPETQPISSEEMTEWLWDLKPKSTGTFDVYLTINAVVEVYGIEKQRQIKTFEKRLTIQITKKQKVERWFHKNWQWAWGAILAPIIGFFFLRKKKE